MLDLLAPLDLNDQRHSLGLDQQVDLTPLHTLSASPAVRSRRQDQGTAQAKMRKQVSDVIENQILELQPQQGTPAAELLDGRKLKQPPFNRLMPRLDESQVEARVIVLDAVALHPKLFARQGIQARVPRHGDIIFLSNPQPVSGQLKH